MIGLGAAIGTFIGHFFFYSVIKGDAKKGLKMGISAGCIVFLLFGIRHAVYG